MRAREPSPASGATDIDPDVVLGWRAGREAAEHDVYLSIDEQAVTDGTAPVETMTETSYGPLSLDLGVTYYWKVNEVNMTETPAMLPADIWSFTVADFIVIDDFEGYDAGENQIWYAWRDGLGFGTPGTEPYYAGNGTGSAVGDDTTYSYTEETIVHGGVKSMPFFYDNSILRYSEAEMTLTSFQDWTKYGINVLSLWFRGISDNAAEPMYVVLNGSAVVTHDNPNAVQLDQWTEWTIDLQRFADQGVNLANVNTIAIGLGNKKNPVAGGSGTIYIDDIQLRRLLQEPEQEPGP